ncbi:MAG: HlyD family efflux transporter periplasmic adaptor subunit [Bacteroidales bacterium]|nr:HlyD family efflux transporter periplasmic adaptor subunit [Bacteroidales bacterium]
MKNAQILFIVVMLSVMTISCSENNNQADAFGNFEATEILVSAMANGQLVRFDVSSGDMLDLDQVVGLVDTIELSLRVLQIEAQQQAVLARLESIKAQKEVQQQQFNNVRKDYDRIMKMYAEGAATARQKDDVEGLLALTGKQIAATEAQMGSIQGEARALGQQVAQIKESIGKCSVTNPVKGTVLTTYANKGEVVSFGKALYKIADLSTMELKVYISGRQLSGFRIGQAVEIHIDQTNNTEYQPLEGVISWIAQSAEFTPKTIQTKEERVDLVYAMKVRVVNDGRLKIGMPGEIRIITN